MIRGGGRGRGEREDGKEAEKIWDGNEEGKGQNREGKQKSAKRRDDARMEKKNY